MRFSTKNWKECSITWRPLHEYQAHDFHCYDVTKAHLLVDVIIDQVYFQLGHSVLRQVCGVPMGGKSSPFIAEFFMAHHETTTFYLERVSLQHATLGFPAYWFRYVDDIHTVNIPHVYVETKINPTFKQAGVDLKATHDTEWRTNYLEVTAEINNDFSLTVKDYSKKRSFGFFVPLLPDYLNNCLPRWIYTHSIAGRFRAYLCFNTAATGFYASAYALAEHLILHRHYPRRFVIEGLKKAYKLAPANKVPTQELKSRLLKAILTLPKFLA
jgi:hypothetical protein